MFNQNSYVMKRFLFTLTLALVALAGCKKDDKGGDVTPPQEPDYVVDAETYGKAQLEGYGNDYENGLNNFLLYWEQEAYKEGYGVTSKVGVSILYFVSPDVTDGTGVLSPDPAEPFAANTYISEIDSEYEGSVYYDYNYVYDKMYVTAFKSGDVTISKEGDIYTIKGSVVTNDGKLVKIDYTGEVDYVYCGS